MVSTVSDYMGQRSALSVLSAHHFLTSLSLNSYLEKLMEPDISTDAFSLHLCVKMAPNTFVSLQSVQSSPKHFRLKKNGTGQHEIVPHCSMASVFLTGLQLNALVQSRSEAIPEGFDDPIILSSLKVSVLGHCSSLQASLAVLLSQHTLTHFPTSLFPQLPPHLSRLDVSVAQSAGLCSLLEAGCSNASITAAARVVTREVSHKALLMWENVRNQPPESNHNPPPSASVNNKLMLSVSLPRLCVDVAAPHTGRVEPSTGGLDLLVAAGIGEAWWGRVQRVARAVEELLATKASRGKAIMLALLSNAARSPLHYKVRWGTCTVLCTVNHFYRIARYIGGN